MFDVPYNNVCIHEVVSISGIDANGATLATCPLCHTDSLQVRQGGGNCYCSSCLEADDIIGIYARARRLPIEEALDELFNEGLIQDGRESFIRYLGDRHDHDAIQAIFEEGQQRILQGSWPSAFAVLNGNGIYVEYGYGMESIASRVGIVHKSDIDDAGLCDHTEFRNLMQWMRGSACLATPIYDHRTKAEGLFVVNRHGQYRVARLGRGNTKRDRAARTKQATLFTRFVRREEEAVVVITEAYEAWQMVLKMCRTSEPLTPVVGVYSEDRVIRPLNDLGPRTYVFWSGDFLSSYYWAEAHNGSHVSTAPWTSEFSSLGSQRLISQIVAQGAERHAAMAAYLASLSESKAQLLVLQLRDNEADLSAVLAAALPVQQARIKQLVAEEGVAGEVRYNGEDVHVGVDGSWRGGSGADSFLISEATIYLSSIAATGGTPYVSGTVQMQGVSYPFQAKLSQVRRGASWLETFLVSVGAPIPFIHKKWRTHLYEIALQFHKPDTTSPEQQLGWSSEDDVLTMPCFRISREGLEPAGQVITDISGGPALTAPMPLQDGGGELEESRNDESFWQLFVYLSAHLLRDRIGAEVPSLALAGPYAAAWASAIRRALCLSYHTASSPQKTVELERRAILPLVVEPVDEDALITWMRLDGHRAIVRVGGSVVALMRYKGWMVFTPENPPAAYVSSLLPQIFWFLVYAIPFIDGLKISATNRGPFWSIGKCVESWAIRQPEGSRRVIESATATLYRGHGVGEQQHDAAWQTLRLIRELADNDCIQVQEDPQQRYYAVNWADVCGIFSRYRISVTSYLTAKRQLAQYTYQGAEIDDTLMINYNDWVLTGTLA